MMKILPLRFNFKNRTPERLPEPYEWCRIQDLDGEIKKSFMFPDKTWANNYNPITWEYDKNVEV